MFYSRESLTESLTQEGYTLIERKPWNVRKDDILVLSQYGMGFLNSGWMTVSVTDINVKKESTYDTNGKISRKTYTFTHKPTSDTDKQRLIGWHRTYAWSTDTVEVWRKK